MENATNTLEQELNQKSDLVLKIGKLCLSSGTGSYRVKQCMHKVADFLGVINEAHITLTEINSTCRQHNFFKTEVCSIPNTGVNTYKIYLLENLCRQLATKTELSATNKISFLDEKLSQIEISKPLYNASIAALSAAVACASFTFLVGGGGVEIISVFLAAGTSHHWRRKLLDQHMNHFTVTALAAGAAACLYLSVLFLLSIADLTTKHNEAGYVASMLFVIPGFPLITGALDIAKLDFSSGLQRISYAASIITCAAFTGWVVACIFHMNPIPLIPPQLDSITLLLLRLLASFSGVFGFSLMFNSPPKIACCAAIIGMVANTLRLELIDVTKLTPQNAALIASILAGILAHCVSKAYNLPRIALSVPAVVIMVPGIFMYRGVYHLGQNNIDSALIWLVKAFLVVLALVIGLIIARTLTDKNWAYDN